MAVLQRSSVPVRVIAGGTDLLTKVQPDAPETRLLIDISDVRELADIELTDEGLHIGAATKLADIESSKILTGVWQVLAHGAAVVGSPQIRNLATIGGNICNAVRASRACIGKVKRVTDALRQGLIKAQHLHDPIRIEEGGDERPNLAPSMEWAREVTQMPGPGVRTMLRTCPAGSPGRARCAADHRSPSRPAPQW